MPSYEWNGYNLAMFTQPFHVFDSHNAFLSEGGALAVVVEALPGKPCWRRVGTDSPRLLRQTWRGRALRVFASPARRTGGEKVEGATPAF